ncbi:MAG: hypothetical protein P1U87_11445 [Verrucomicrobiales bacterium]|nr:hypothetical protein [Verrucomicrobiales bacterium]
MRLLALWVMRLGLPTEAVAITGMVVGILAGLSFMATSELSRSSTFWALGLVFCILRIVSIRIDAFLQKHSEGFVEDEYFQELPERVSDAVALIGFGFASLSNPWLGLATALAAIFSAYVRSLGMLRGAAKEKASSGPMTRIHRLVLLSLTSILMMFDISEDRFDTSIPEITLWIIFLGCIATILIRLIKIRR